MHDRPPHFPRVTTVQGFGRADGTARVIRTANAKAHPGGATSHPPLCTLCHIVSPTLPPLPCSSHSEGMSHLVECKALVCTCARVYAWRADTGCARVTRGRQLWKLGTTRAWPGQNRVLATVSEPTFKAHPRETSLFSHC